MTGQQKPERDHCCKRDQPQRIPQLAASSGGTSKTLDSVAMVAICEPPPTAGSCNIDPTMLDPIRISSCDTGISSASTP
jgi:hypothetical protein